MSSVKLNLTFNCRASTPVEGSQAGGLGQLFLYTVCASTVESPKQDSKRLFLKEDEILCPSGYIIYLYLKVHLLNVNGDILFDDMLRLLTQHAKWIHFQMG